MSVFFEELKNTKTLRLTEKQMIGIIVAMAGRHNILMYGAPGYGKSLVGSNLGLLRPELTDDESQSVTRIHSVAGMIKAHDVVKAAPFRMPHQTASIEGMCGGGPNILPGEISLAHNGILFLDEASNFRTSVLQMLRVPLESNSITLSRAGRSVVYPANFQLIMAVNPCPCGNFGSPDKVCLCSARTIEQYWKKFSEPLLDKIDIKLDFNAPDCNKQDYEIEHLRKLMAKAISTQRNRGIYNGDINHDRVVELCPIDDEAQKIMSKIDDLSARKKLNVIKVARTVADIHQIDVIDRECIETAIDLCMIKSFPY